MRTTIAAALCLVACSALPARAQTALQLQWELKGDVFADARDRGASRAVFTLTNNDTTPLPARGWAIYFNALLPRTPGSERGGIVIEPVIGELFRMVPDASFKGLAPGQSVQFEYLTGLIGNVTQAPAGPYIVFDRDPAKGYAIKDYRALPFERPDQQGRAPRVVTPEAQYERNAVIRDLPAESLPPIFPTPQSLQMKDGSAAARPRARDQRSADLEAEAALAASRPPRRASAADETRQQAEARDRVRRGPALARGLRADGGLRPASASWETPAPGVFYGLQSLRSLLPAAGSAAAGMVLPAMRVVDAPRFGYRGLAPGRGAELPAQADRVARARPDGALQAQRAALPHHRR